MPSKDEFALCLSNICSVESVGSCTMTRVWPTTLSGELHFCNSRLLREGGVSKTSWFFRSTELFSSAFPSSRVSQVDGPVAESRLGTAALGPRQRTPKSPPRAEHGGKGGIQNTNLSKYGQRLSECSDDVVVSRDVFLLVSFLLPYICVVAWLRLDCAELGDGGDNRCFTACVKSDSSIPARSLSNLMAGHCAKLSSTVWFHCLGSI